MIAELYYFYFDAVEIADIVILDSISVRLALDFWPDEWLTRLLLLETQTLGLG